MKMSEYTYTLKYVTLKIISGILSLLNFVVNYKS